MILDKYGNPITATPPGGGRHPIRRLHEFDKTNKRHPYRKIGPQSGNAVMNVTRGRIREAARWLVENHDVAVAIVETLKTRIVGGGTRIEPLVMTTGGQLSEKVNDQIRRILSEWMRTPDVTGELTGMELERLAVGSWITDGEVFAQHVGAGSGFDFVDLPYAVELIEADLVPFDATVQRSRAVHGVERDTWGRPIRYLVYLDHPGDFGIGSLGSARTKWIPAEAMLHLKTVNRIGQVRGVSMFASVIDRILDLHSYEADERFAAKVAAQMTAYVKRDVGAELPDDFERDDFMLEGGSTFELAPGEDVGLIASNRPNAGLADFVNDQLRRAAAATQVNSSTITRNYNNSYSAQRQELVDCEEGYNVLRRKYYGDFLIKIYRQVIAAAMLDGRLKMRGADLATVFDVWMRGPAMPSIDPAKEAKANETEINTGTTSRHDVIRGKGRDPRQVDREIEADTFEPKGQAEPPRRETDKEDPDDEQDGNNRNAA